MEYPSVEVATICIFYNSTRLTEVIASRATKSALVWGGPLRSAYAGCFLCVLAFYSMYVLLYGIAIVAIVGLSQRLAV